MRRILTNRVSFVATLQRLLTANVPLLRAPTNCQPSQAPPDHAPEMALRSLEFVAEFPILNANLEG